MKEFIILTDSCCDLSADMAREQNLEVLPLSFRLQDQEYKDWLDGRDMSHAVFYQNLRKGEIPKTAAVSVGDFEDAMRRHLQQGRDILCILFSAALSTTYQSAVIAAEGLREEFPEGKILVVDSLSACGGEGMLVYLCSQQKALGKSIDEVFAYAQATAPQICHWFTVDDLNYLKQGGRISGATALVGSMLAIKPILHIDAEGRLVSVDKVRGRKAALLDLVARMEKTAIDPQIVFINHGDCAEDAAFLGEEIRRRFGVETIITEYVGAVIGSHTGPGTMTLFFLGRER